MELDFHASSPTNNNLTSPRSRNRAANKSKFVGVRQRPSGKWVAEIKNTTQKIRMWLGTFDTAEEAALAYDEAAFLLRGSNTRTNFLNNVPCNPALSLKIRNLLHQKRRLNKATPPSSFASSASTKCSSQETIVDTSVYDDPASSSQNSINATPSIQARNAASFEDAYKPDLSYFMAGHEYIHSSHHDQTSFTCTVDFNTVSLPQDGIYMPKRGCKDLNEAQLLDFECRQISTSTSLYETNGMGEHWENIGDSTNESFWDIPSLCEMFCPS